MNSPARSVSTRPARALAALVLTLAAQHAAAEPLWPCGSRSGSDLLPMDLMPRLEAGPIIADMRQMARTADDPMPRGGTYGAPPVATNLTRPSDMTLRLTLFDAACDVIVVDGQPVSADHLPPGATLTHSGPTMILRLGPDANVVLRGLPLTTWAEGAARQIHGTAGDDHLRGTEGADVLVPGGGHDRVVPGAGDDRIIFSRGDTVIAPTPPGSGTDNGTDSLDLRRFALTDLTLTATGPDLVIATTDGTLRLLDQLTDAGNIDTLLLANGQTLTAAQLRAAAR